jgi:type IV pilus assembly protein PilY1
MLHAFNANNGTELWAYVPTAVMSNMWRLADANYDTGHRYFVDATPVVGDVYDGTNWRTILVGGLGAGGRSYYALDITDPANPKSLWEFSASDDADLGLAFGNPVITKNKAGTWVVVFSSGYNNGNTVDGTSTGAAQSPAGNGNGHLYVRNAITGAAIDKISTYTAAAVPAGSASAPSGLGKINPWIEVETNNTATRFYGGDMLGNLWRFDFDDNIAPPGKEALLLGQAQTSGGTIQPITTRPITFKVGGVSTLPAVAFATGRYLGTGDVGDTTTQSLYVVKETLGTTGLGVIRSNAGIVAQSMNASRVVTATAVDWSTKGGWYVDFPAAPSGSSSERVNVDMQQSGKLLVAATNQPAPSACNAGGNSALYTFDVSSGALTNTALTFTTLTAGLNLIKVGGVLKIIRWDTSGNPTVTTPTLPGGTTTTTRRTSWREIVN